MFAESLSARGDIDEQEIYSTDDNISTEKVHAHTGKQEGSDPTRPPAQSPKIEVLEVGTSDTEETNELQLTHGTPWVEVMPDTRANTQDIGERHADADQEDSQLSIDDADIHSTLQSIQPRHSLHLAAASVTPHSSPAKQDTNNVSIHPSTRSPERPGSRGSMHSLFSNSLEDERTVSSQAPILPIDRNEDKVQEKACPTHIPRHDSEAWKEPSFIAKHKGEEKARAVEELDTSSVKAGKKRQQSAQPESPVPKRTKVSPSEVRRAASGRTTRILRIQHQDTEASALGKIHPNKRLSTSLTDTTEIAAPPLASQLSKPRLANFIVDFEKIDLGKGVPMPRLDLDKDIKGMLLRTGRIRTLGERVEKDGSVYIHL